MTNENRYKPTVFILKPSPSARLGTSAVGWFEHR
jgi:hypothetical protein